MTVKEYVSILTPSIVASVFMVIVLLGVRVFVPSGMPPLIALCISIGTGVLAYVGALLVFYRQRVNHLLKTTRELLKGRE